MGILDGKKILVTGVLNNRSFAFGVLKACLAQGAQVVVTTQNNETMPRTQDALAQLEGEDIPILVLDVTNEEEIAAVAESLKQRWGYLDGVLHSVAHAPESAMGLGFMSAPDEAVVEAFVTSSLSLRNLVRGLRDLLSGHPSSVVALTFAPTQAWPGYAWMGPCKAALTSIVQYLARLLGSEQIRVNLVSAGPTRTAAARGIPGFSQLAASWKNRAPLGWDLNNQEQVGKTVALLFSDLTSLTTGDTFYADGGAHAMGSDLIEQERVGQPETTPGQ